MIYDGQASALFFTDKSGGNSPYWGFLDLGGKAEPGAYNRVHAMAGASSGCATPHVPYLALVFRIAASVVQKELKEVEGIASC